MTNITDVNDDLTTLLGAVSGIERSYSYDELPESHNEMPAVEVYPDHGSGDRISFSGDPYADEWVFFADFYITMRSNLPDDIGATVPYIDSVLAKLESDPQLAGTVEEMSWEWIRGNFTRAKKDYSGLRFTITVEVY